MDMLKKGVSKKATKNAKHEFDTGGDHGVFGECSITAAGSTAAC